jgi:hypothetical protein
MPADDRDILDVLKFELDFLESGGYGRSVRTPQKPTSIFQDSLSCLNFGDPSRPHPCDDCLLHELVPEQSRNETVPCHHIPLDEQGHTLESLDRGYNQQEMEEALKNWLRQNIRRIEQQRAQRIA